jgi:HEAT repeat protein
LKAFAVLASLSSAEPAVPQALREALKQKGGIPRAQVVGILSWMGKAAAPLLAEALKNEDRAVRLQAAIGLQELGRDAQGATAALRNALGDPDPYVCVEAAVALAAVSREDAKASLAWLLQALKEVRFKEHRYEVAIALSRLGPAAEAVVPVLMALHQGNDPDGRLDQQNAVIDALGRIGSGAKAAVPLLVKALAHPSFPVRFAAAGALSQIDPGQQGARAPLYEGLKNENYRVKAAVVLVRLDPGKTKVFVDYLTTLLRDESEFVREQAAGGLGEIGPEARSAVPAILPLLRDPYVRRTAMAAIGKIEGKASK